jgi:hypothetical protein
MRSNEIALGTKGQRRVRSCFLVNVCFPYGRLGLWIQPIDATVWWNRSAGVSKFNVFLGRSFNLLATALSFACE